MDSSVKKGDEATVVSHLEKKGRRKGWWIALLLLWGFVVLGLSHQPYEQQNLKPLLRVWFSPDALRRVLPDLSFYYEGRLISTEMSPIGFVEFILRKTAHFGLYAVGAVLCFFALRRLGLRHGWVAWAVAAFVVLFAGLDEVQQLFVSGRTSAWADVGVDLLGASLALGVLLWRRNRRLPSRQKKVAWSGWAGMTVLGAALLAFNVQAGDELTPLVGQSGNPASPYADVFQLVPDRPLFEAGGHGGQPGAGAHAAPSASGAGVSPSNNGANGAEPEEKENSKASSSTASDRPTQAEIVAAYRGKLEALRSACRTHLSSLADQAYAEYRAAKARGQALDIGAMYNRYAGKARELQGVCDTAFYRLLRQMESDLNRYGYPLDPVWEAEAAYEQQKQAEKARLMQKVQALLQR